MMTRQRCWEQWGSRWWSTRTEWLSEERRMLGSLLRDCSCVANIATLLSEQSTDRKHRRREAAAEGLAGNQAFLITIVITASLSVANLMMQAVSLAWSTENRAT
jgi:hypothetical protein